MGQQEFTRTSTEKFCCYMRTAFLTMPLFHLLCNLWRGKKLLFRAFKQFHTGCQGPLKRKAGGSQNGTLLRGSKTHPSVQPSARVRFHSRQKGHRQPNRVQSGRWYNFSCISCNKPQPTN